MANPESNGAPVTDDEQRHAWELELRRELFLNGCVPLRELAEYLGISEPQVDILLERGLITDRVNRVTVVPVWQFYIDGTLIEGVLQLAACFYNAITLTAWMMTPCKALGRQTPLALLLQGQSARVIEHARSLVDWS